MLVIGIFRKGEINMTEQEYRNEFSKRLKNMIKDKEITQKELSKLTGISEHTISNYVTGQITPSLFHANEIARALHRPINYFNI